MSEIRVECYAGYRAGERPLRFIIRGRQFIVNELDGRWYSPEASYFRVRADDGNYYVLRHDEAQDFWTLDGFRAARDESKGTVQETTRKIDFRRHQRILVPGAVEIRVASRGNGPAVDGIVTVMGLGGMFCRTKDTRSLGTTLSLRLTCPSILLELGCTVRHVNQNGMGIEFTSVTPENELKLKELLLQLRA